MPEFSSAIVKLHVLEFDNHLLTRIMKGEAVTVTLQHTGYRDGTEAQLHMTDPKRDPDA